MSQLDPYYLLGVPLNATPEEIRVAYRRRAAESHPDIHPPEKRDWALEQMKQLNGARDLLLDPKRRAKYDEQMRLEMQKARWRARRDAYAPPPPPEDFPAWRRQRPRWWGCSWPVNVLVMFFLLGLCAYTLPFLFTLSTTPQADVLQDPVIWLVLAGKLFLSILSLVFGPLFFALVIALILAGVGQFWKR